MAIKTALQQEEQGDSSPKDKKEDDLDEVLSTYDLSADAMKQEREAKLKERSQKAFNKNILTMVMKISQSNSWLEHLHGHLDSMSTKVTCMEKRGAVKVASGWDFSRMVGVEVDTYGKVLAVKNLKCFVIFRAQQIKKELGIGMSWKTFLKHLWCKMLGKSLPWELACKELLEGLKGKIAFLKSEDGWAENFNKNMAEVTKQPW